MGFTVDNGDAVCHHDRAVVKGREYHRMASPQEARIVGKKPRPRSFATHPRSISKRFSREPVGLTVGLFVGVAVGSNVTVGAGENDGGKVGQPIAFVTSVTLSRRLQDAQGMAVTRR